MARPIRITDDLSYQPNREPGIVELMKTLVTETTELVRSEANVLKLELQESTRAMIVDAVKAAIYGGAALLGVFSLMAFFIIAFGEMLSGTRPTGYWVSALLIGLILTIGGGLMASRYAKRIGASADLPKTRGEAHINEALAKKEFSDMKADVKEKLRHELG